VPRLKDAKYAQILLKIIAFGNFPDEDDFRTVI
jgi:hypothetical protein